MSNRKVKTIIVVSIVVIAFALIMMNFDLRLDRFGNSKISWTDCIQKMDNAIAVRIGKQYYLYSIE